VLFYGLPAEVLEQVIVAVKPVEGSAGRVDFVEIRKIVVNEVVKRLGRTHHRM
jgi:hypothetical protein